MRIAAHPFSVMSYTRGLTRLRLLSDCKALDRRRGRDRCRARSFESVPEYRADSRYSRMQGLLRHAARRVVAVSPIIGGQALKGPAGKIMSELGLEVSAAGWTHWMNEHYPGLVDVWVWDETDQQAADDLRAEGMDIRTTSTVMSDPGRAAFGDWLLGFVKCH